MKKTLISLLIFSQVVIGIEVYPFESEEQETRYQKLTKELRCLVCQNQNLADSDAGLAKDLKDKVAEFVIAGKSEAQITQYMIDRYGEFVSYQPPMNLSTLFLWVSPMLLLLIGGVILTIRIQKTQQ